MRRWAGVLAGLLTALALQAETAPEWRTWTSADGATIEAYLKQVLPDGIVIVRRDGQEFTAPLGRFSEGDRAYVTRWMQEKLPRAADFRALDFRSIALPQSHEIAAVPHVRARGSEPNESAALRMVLDFHGIAHDETLADRIRAREGRGVALIPARDLAASLQGVPVETEIFQGPTLRPRGVPRREDDSAQVALNAIRKAISLDLPVIIGHRPEFEEDTPEFAAVAVGYDRRNLRILDPAGTRSTVRLDLRDLEESLVYALIIFPAVQLPEAGTVAQPAAPPTEFLSRVSAAIREVPVYEAPALVELLRERGLNATLQDINRSDFSNQLGRTRSFARQGGLPEIEAALNGGRVAVIPQEFEDGTGFALVYSQAEDGFAAVEFRPDRTFRRGTVSRGDLANRWLTRENRSYRLDLIQIEISRAEAPAATPPTPPAPPRGEPSGRPPPPPRR